MASQEIISNISWYGPYHSLFIKALDQATTTELIRAAYNVLDNRTEHERIKLLRLNAIVEKLDALLKPAEESDENMAGF